MRKIVSLAFGAALMVVANVANAAVTYTFDTGNQGWTVGDVDGTTPAPNHAAGWAAGKLVIGDEAGNTGVYAPSAVLGNQSAAYGGSISFDVSDFNNDGVAYTALILYGANGLAAAVNGGPPSTDSNALSTLSFALNETVFSNFAGGDYAGTTPISQSQFRSILANLSGIAFRTEYNTGPDDSRFDNATFTGFVDPSAPPVVAGVPEPASWAMMIAGFGAIGAAMRRRKVVVSFV